MEAILALFNKFAKAELDVLILRVGLGLVFLYAGTASLESPTNWVGFVPDFVGWVVPKETFLTAHSFFELALGVGLVAGLWTPVLSMLAFLSLFSILIFFGIDEVTFRDFGLAVMALALFTRVARPRAHAANQMFGQS